MLLASTMAGPETCKGKTGELVTGRVDRIEVGRVEAGAGAL